MAERASAIAQTTGVISRYQQLTEIWGMDPDEAERNLSELRQDFILDTQFAQAAAPVPPQAPPLPGTGGATAGAVSPQNQAAAATARVARVAKQHEALQQRRTAKASANAS
jgi:hypothetical protein